jgi:hypothetical protein
MPALVGAGRPEPVTPPEPAGVQVDGRVDRARVAVGLAQGTHLGDARGRGGVQQRRDDEDDGPGRADGEAVRL